MINALQKFGMGAVLIICASGVAGHAKAAETLSPTDAARIAESPAAIRTMPPEVVKAALEVWQEQEVTSAKNEAAVKAAQAKVNAERKKLRLGPIDYSAKKTGLTEEEVKERIRDKAENDPSRYQNRTKQGLANRKSMAEIKKINAGSR